MYEPYDDNYWVVSAEVGISVEKVFKHMDNKQLLYVEIYDYVTEKWHIIFVNLLSGTGKGTTMATFKVEIIGGGVVPAHLQVEDPGIKDYYTHLSGSF